MFPEIMRAISLILVGDSCVGKTALLNRLENQNEPLTTIATHGFHQIYLKIREVKVLIREVKVLIRDSCGNQSKLVPLLASSCQYYVVCYQHRKRTRKSVMNELEFWDKQMPSEITKLTDLGISHSAEDDKETKLTEIVTSDETHQELMVRLTDLLLPIIESLPKPTTRPPTNADLLTIPRTPIISSINR